MSRYIDIDPVLREAYRQIKNHVTVDLLEEVPTADVVEIVRGEWIQHDEGVYQEKEKNWWHCSNCGNVIYSEHEDDRKEFHKWCGRCGAYMRGEDDAEIH